MADQINSITTKEESIYMPIMTIADAIERRNALVNFTKSIMEKDRDFGTIPGTDKPTLYKAGAEKLASFFGMTPKFIVVDKILDFDKGLFYYHYKCELYRNGRFMGDSEGSANSMEKKHRYRNVAEKKATAEDKAMSIRKETKSGKYGDYVVYVVPNSEPYDLVNTLQKMAEKRALVAAVLVTTNASEFYTQDVEDMNIIDGEWHDPEGDKKSQSQSQSPKPNGAPKSESAKNNKSTISPRIQCLIDNGLVLTIEEAAALLNKLNPSSDKTIEDIVKMARELTEPTAELEPVTEQPPAPPKTPEVTNGNQTSLDYKTIIMRSGHAQNETQAKFWVQFMNPLPKTEEAVIAWAKAMRGWLDSDKKPAEAAKLANEGKYPK